MKIKAVKSLLKIYTPDVCQAILFYTFLKNNSIDTSTEIEYVEIEEKYNSCNVKDDVCLNLSILTIYELVSALEVIIPSTDQKVNGAFFTPNHIVKFIIEELRPTEGDLCLDPSCGSGAFLVGLVDYYRNKFEKPLNKIIEENIYGVDILEYNANRAKLVLKVYGSILNEPVDFDKIRIYADNSLTHRFKRNFDIIIGNPPYVKLQDIPVDDRVDLKLFKTINAGSFNLYFAFFELAFDLLSDRGKMGYITPNNYFTSLSGKSLRTWFTSNKCISKVIDFGSTKVFDAQTYTCITFLNKMSNSLIAYDRIGPSESIESFLLNSNVDSVPISTLNDKKWRLLKSSDRLAIEKIEKEGTPLSQIFDISVGIATLKDALYYVDSRTKKNKFYEILLEGEAYKIEKEITRPLIKISDFKNQESLKLNSRRIIFPYKYVKGRMVVIPVNEIKFNYPNTFLYLQAIKEQLLSRDKGKKIYDPFYQYGRSQGLSRKGLKVITPTFSKYPRFLNVADSGSLFTNGYGLFSKNKDPRLFRNHILSLDNNIDVLVKVLNSSTMDYYVNKTSVSIAGGYPCYQKNFIEKFSIPDMNQVDVDMLRSLNSKTSIDNYVKNLYGLNVLSGNLV